MSINDIDESIKQSKPEEVGTGSEQPISKPAGEEMIYKKVAETLGIENFSDMEKYKNEIKMISDYVHEQGGEDIMDFEWKVKQLEMRIPTPSLGEKRISNLARYVYLLTENKRIKEQIDKMGGVE
jgi:hypothetical protein